MATRESTSGYARSGNGEPLPRLRRCSRRARRYGNVIYGRAARNGIVRDETASRPAIRDLARQLNEERSAVVQRQSYRPVRPTAVCAAARICGARCQNHAPQYVQTRFYAYATNAATVSSAHANQQSQRTGGSRQYSSFVRSTVSCRATNSPS